MRGEEESEKTKKTHSVRRGEGTGRGEREENGGKRDGRRERRRAKRRERAGGGEGQNKQINVRVACLLLGGDTVTTPLSSTPSAERVAFPPCPPPYPALSYHYHRRPCRFARHCPTASRRRPSYTVVEVTSATPTRPGHATGCSLAGRNRPNERGIARARLVRARLPLNLCTYLPALVHPEPSRLATAVTLVDSPGTRRFICRWPAAFCRCGRTSSHSSYSDRSPDVAANGHCVSHFSKCYQQSKILDKISIIDKLSKSFFTRKACERMHMSI